MVRIAICDDQDIFQGTIKNKLNLLLKKECIKAQIDCYDSGDKLIKFLKENKGIYDILFLDILMSDINGLDVAQEIRTFDNRMQIIFLTSSSDYILQGYDVEALGYLIKGQEDKKLEEVLLKAIEKTDKNYDDYIMIKSGSFIRTICLKNIEFIEVRNRTITINTDDETIEFNGKMEDMQNELLCKNFILTHRSYLVNVRKIKHIGTSSIELKSGKEVLLSRLRSKGVKKAYLDYIFEYNKEE